MKLALQSRDRSKNFAWGIFNLRTGHSGVNEQTGCARHSPQRKMQSQIVKLSRNAVSGPWKENTLVGRFVAVVVEQIHRFAAREDIDRRHHCQQKAAGHESDLRGAQLHQCQLSSDKEWDSQQLLQDRDAQKDGETVADHVELQICLCSDIPYLHELPALGHIAKLQL